MLPQQKKEEDKKIQAIVPSRSQVFLSRATSPCSSYLQSSCAALSYQRAVISLAPQTSAAALWATWALSAASSQRRIRGRRAFSDPGSTSPWFSSSRPRQLFHPERFSLSPAHILAARLRLPMSRRIKLNLEAARKLLWLRTWPGLGRGRRHTAVCLSVCLVGMLFSAPTRPHAITRTCNRYKLHYYHDILWLNQYVCV